MKLYINKQLVLNLAQLIFIYLQTQSLINRDKYLSNISCTDKHKIEPKVQSHINIIQMYTPLSPPNHSDLTYYNDGITVGKWHFICTSKTFIPQYMHNFSLIPLT